MQQHLVEIIPGAAGRLHQHGSLNVGNVDTAFNAGHLLEQRLLIDDARRRIGRAVRGKLLGESGRGRRHCEQQQNEGHEANARKKPHGH